MKTLIPIFLLVGASQGFFLALALFFRKNNFTANRVLASLIFLLSIELFCNYILFSNIYKPAIHWILLVNTFGFLYGPLIYLYVGLITAHIKKLRFSHLSHGVLFLLYFSYHLTYFQKTPDEIIDLFNKVRQDISFYPFYEIAMDCLLYIVIIYYISYAIIVLFRYSRNVRNYFSNISQINLRWLIVLTMLTFLCWLISAISYGMFYIDPVWSDILDTVFLVMAGILIYSIGYFALVQHEIFSKTHQMADELAPAITTETEQNFDMGTEESESNPSSEKYSRTKLTEEQLDNYLREIESYIKDSQIYTNPEVTIKDFSERINIPSHYISQVINTRLGKNFFHFINHYRIEHALRFLSDKEQTDRSILEIAYEVGFNSKTTFNVIFKKYTGLTPSLYRKQQLG